MMSKLSNYELLNVNGGASWNSAFNKLYEIYRIIKIKWLMKKVFID